MGSVQEVLVEDFDATTGSLVGRTATNKLVHAKSTPRVYNKEDQDLTGHLVAVSIKKGSPHALTGEVMPK